MSRSEILNILSRVKSPKFNKMDLINSPAYLEPPIWQMRFEQKISPEPNSGCWIWAGASNRLGYGRFNINQKIEYAHRLSWQLHKGEIPTDKQIDHLCRVRLCVNPDHMEVVSHRTNSLRGMGVGGINSRKTHCKNGHELSGANLKLTLGDMYRCQHRRCVQCAKAYENKRNERRRGEPRGKNKQR